MEYTFVRCGLTGWQLDLIMQVCLVQVRNVLCILLLLSFIICNIYDLYNLEPPMPRPIVMTESVVNLTVNDYILVMKCLPNRNNFNYIWTKKNDDLPSRARGISSSQLTINNLNPKDSGDYRCVMSNRTGNISSKFTTVYIEGKKINNI